MKDSFYQCVDCKQPLENWHCSACGRVFAEQERIRLAWPSDLSDLEREEADYHDEFDENAIETHQLESWRNLFYHKFVWEKIKQLPRGGRLLEVGAGSGFDAEKLRDDYELKITDISPKTLARTREKLGNRNIEYIAAEGSRLPFANQSFDGVYMFATLHHLEKPGSGVVEFLRVLKPQGLFVAAIEPNSFYFRWIKRLRGLLCYSTHAKKDEGSQADAEMEGFSCRELRELFSDNAWSDIKIKPVWLLAGYWHYFLEFIFRALKLKKRIVLPVWLEKIIVGVDEVLFKIPGFKYLGWHWIIITRRK